METCLSCMWVSLSPSASNSSVVFFRDAPLVSSYGPVRIINNITLHSFPPPTSLPSSRNVTQSGPISPHLVIWVTIKEAHGGCWSCQLITAPSCKGSQISPSASAHLLILLKALLLLYISELLTILPINLCVCVRGIFMNFFSHFVLLNHNQFLLTASQEL